jgi:hypothetical protein
VASTLTYRAAGTLLLEAFDFRYLSDNSFVDVPLEALSSTDKLYVNCGPPLWHNRYRNATRHAIVLDAANVISDIRCSQKDGMC